LWEQFSDIILNKRPWTSVSVFKQEIGPDRTSRDYQQVGRTAMSIRAYQEGHHTQSSTVAAALGRPAPGYRYRSEQLWVPCVLRGPRSLNRSRVVARDGMEIPSWGSSHSSRAPAHDRLALGRGGPSPRWPRRDFVMKLCSDATLDHLEARGLACSPRARTVWVVDMAGRC